MSRTHEEIQWEWMDEVRELLRTIATNTVPRSEPAPETKFAYWNGRCPETMNLMPAPSPKPGPDETMQHEAFMALNRIKARVGYDVDTVTIHRALELLASPKPGRVPVEAILKLVRFVQSFVLTDTERRYEHMLPFANRVNDWLSSQPAEEPSAEVVEAAGVLRSYLETSNAWSGYTAETAREALATIRRALGLGEKP